MTAESASQDVQALPCPYCGDKEAPRPVVFIGRGRTWTQVVCFDAELGCGAAGPRVRVPGSKPIRIEDAAGALAVSPTPEDEHTVRLAIAEWNARVTDAGEMERLLTALRGNDLGWLARWRRFRAALLAPGRN